MNTEVAKNYVESFARRYGEAHLQLACQAAFPLALTPDLLYRVWATFQRDSRNQFLKIPWVAVSEVLLSNLCQEVGYELYEMPKPIRDELLQRLQQSDRFGPARIHQLADFLLEYVRQQSYSADPDAVDFAQAQQWTSLAYTHPPETARQISQAFCELMQPRAADDYPKGEIIRLASVVEALSVPLVAANLEPLVIYARGLESFALGDLVASAAHLSQLSEDGQIWIAGMEVPVPDVIRDSLDSLQLPPGPDFSHQNLRDRSFKGQDLTRADFTGADIQGADFTHAILIRAKFSKATCGIKTSAIRLWVISGFLLSMLSGLTMVAAGWLLGLQMTPQQQPFSGAALLSLLVLGGGILLYFNQKRRAIKAPWDRRIISAGTATAALLTLLAYGLSAVVVYASTQRLQPMTELVTFCLVSGVLAMVTMVLGKQTKRPVLLMSARLLGIASLITIGYFSWLGTTLPLTPLTILALIGVPLILQSCGLVALLFATITSWQVSLSTIGVIVGSMLILQFFNGLSFTNLSGANWVMAIFLGVGTVALSLSAFICSRLATVVLWLDTETVWMAQLWATVATVLGSLMLYPAYLLGQNNLYPPFRVKEDLVYIVPMVTIAIGIGLYITYRELHLLNRPAQQQLPAPFKSIALALGATSGTRFFGANLTNADFSDASMKAADLRKATLIGTRFHGATQLGLVCADRQFRNYLQVRSRLDTAQNSSPENPPNLDKLDLQSINLSRMNLSKASLVDTNLKGANLKGTNLSEAILHKTQLADANLSGANLTGAYIVDWQINSGTQLGGVRCNYIFTQLSKTNEPSPVRYPKDPRRIFAPGEFAMFIRRSPQVETKASRP